MLTKLKTKTTNVAVMEPTPHGFSLTKKFASEIFGIKGLNIEMPVFQWKEENPDVPTVNEHYQFNEETLLPVLWALKTGRKAWLHGHTGTGKSTLITQVCARLNWPMKRVNFDSEITRMDLIGRDVLKNDGGVTTSEFVDGILPQAMVEPCVLLCDEVDFIRPEVSYVYQRVLEDEGLLVTEDGGRLVKPNRFFRIIATSNTQGQGDEFGIYQGARAQSLAFLDRFTVWVKCDYLPEDQETAIIKALVPDLPKDRLKEVVSYAKEHRAAFLGSKLMQPLSPRGIVAFAEGIVMYDSLKTKDALKKAATVTLLHKANPSDAAVIKGILDRIEHPYKDPVLTEEAKKKGNP